ncbi:MAG: glycosyltransferase family 2 protein, partial [Patescibacteria group bacterium]
MMIQDGVSVFIPAYNEAGSLAAAVANALHSVSSILPRYQILIVDDASSDTTQTIGQKLAKENKHCMYIRRSTNGGLGEAFRSAMPHVTMPFVTWFPGDNDTSARSLKNLIQVRHKADLVMSYSANTWTRSWLRRCISWGFTTVLNVLFGLHVRYYNGCFIAKTDIVRSVILKSSGHAVFAELKLRLIANGVSYREIPFYHIGRKSGVTSAFRWKNITATFATLWMLFRDIRIK